MFPLAVEEELESTAGDMSDNYMGDAVLGTYVNSTVSGRSWLMVTAQPRPSRRARWVSNLNVDYFEDLRGLLLYVERICNVVYRVWLRRAFTANVRNGRASPD